MGLAVEVRDEAGGGAAIADNRQLSFDAMLLKSLAYQPDVALIILDQKNGGRARRWGCYVLRRRPGL